eukprot:2258390-Prymnesium_polylepis.1
MGVGCGLALPIGFVIPIPVPAVLVSLHVRGSRGVRAPRCEDTGYRSLYALQKRVPSSAVSECEVLATVLALGHDVLVLIFETFGGFNKLVVCLLKRLAGGVVRNKHVVHVRNGPVATQCGHCKAAPTRGGAAAGTPSPHPASESPSPATGPTPGTSGVQPKLHVPAQSSMAGARSRRSRP